jgi:hypothetical protein
MCRCNDSSECKRRRSFIALYDHGDVLKTRPRRSSKARAGNGRGSGRGRGAGYTSKPKTLKVVSARN